MPNKQSPRRIARRAAPADPTAADTPVESAAAAPRRRVQRVSAVRQPRIPKGTLGVDEFASLDPDDAAIPFERAPYVPRDLRRVLVIAALMIVIIIIATFVVPRLTGN